MLIYFLIKRIITTIIIIILTTLGQYKFILNRDNNKKIFTNQNLIWYREHGSEIK